MRSGPRAGARVSGRGTRTASFEAVYVPTFLALIRMDSDEGAKKGDTYKEYMSPVLARPYEIGAERGHVLKGPVKAL